MTVLRKRTKIGFPNFTLLVFFFSKFELRIKLLKNEKR